MREAVLYERGDTDDFSPKRTWGPIDIPTRKDVAGGRQQWCDLLHEILRDLNDIFEQRPGTATMVPDVLHDRLFADLIDRHRPSYAASLTQARKKQSNFRTQMDLWWTENRHNHPGLSASQALAEANILNWLNKLILAHCLKQFHRAASAVDSITPKQTALQAQKVFEDISAACNFMAVFQNMPGQEHVDQATWQSLLEVNALLINTHLEAVGQSLLTQTLNGTVEHDRQKAFGQFTTPAPLADFLVRLAMDDIEGTILAPCCGAGTIARAAHQ